LKKYGLSATIFVATGAVGTGEVLWHERVFDSFRYATARSPVFPAETGLSVDLASEDSSRESFHRVVSYAKQLPGGKREQFVDQVERTLEPDLRGRERMPMLKWGQIREMRDAGIDFGSHTVTHAILSRTGDEQLKRELGESKRILEQQLCGPMVAFAYPNGQSSDYDERVKTAVRDAGYSFAVTTLSGFNTASVDPFELRRETPWHSDPDLFRMYLFMRRHAWKN
jgi:peptidoglycan/xylan/chitin deacetylase (PgdA/CDA1 family)